MKTLGDCFNRCGFVPRFPDSFIIISIVVGVLRNFSFLRPNLPLHRRLSRCCSMLPNSEAAQPLIEVATALLNPLSCHFSDRPGGGEVGGLCVCAHAPSKSLFAIMMSLFVRIHGLI